MAHTTPPRRPTVIEERNRQIAKGKRRALSPTRRRRSNFSSLIGELTRPGPRTSPKPRSPRPSPTGGRDRLTSLKNRRTSIQKRMKTNSERIRSILGGR